MRDFVIEMWGENWVFHSIFLLCCVLLSLAVGLVGSAVYVAIDESGGPILTASGRVVSTEYVPPYTSVVIVGKMIIPQSHPARWEIAVDVDGSILRGSFSEKCANPGEWKKVSYGYGRLSKEKFLRGIE